MEIDLLAKPRNELPNKLHYMPSWQVEHL
jgi:hypothetical protein